MPALLRNPFYRRLSRLSWVPTLIGIAIVGMGRPELLQGGGALTGLCLFVLLSAMLVAWLQGARARRSAHALAADQRYRFLCPECLQFGDLAYACGACGTECSASVVDAGGGYVNDCGHCHSALLPDQREGAVGLRAYCHFCRATVGRQPHHERRICVIGVVRKTDLAHFARLVAPVRQVDETTSGLRLDDGAWLTFVLDLTALSTDARSNAHAARRLDALWLAGGDASPLELGEQLDNFIRRTRLSVSKRRQLRVCVGSSRQALPGELFNVLRGRFPNSAKLEYLVTPEVLIEQLTTRVDQGAGLKPPRVLATLDEEDWRALRQVTDQYGAPLVNPDGWFRQSSNHTIRLYNQELVHPKGHDCALELAGLEAVWLSGRVEWRSVIDRIDRLTRLAGLSPQQVECLVVCVQDAQPGAQLRSALHSRFRTVRTAVTAEEFLWHGCEARAPALLNGPRHILSTCLPGDFETLFREMGPLQRQRLSAAWAVEETGDRTSFLVDLGDPGRPPDSPVGVPALGELQAVWLGETLPGSLELAERLDRLIRNVWGSAQRRRGIAVCAWVASPDPGLRNVLESRFGTVRYGVSAREFLEHGARAANRERSPFEQSLRLEPI